MAGYSCEEKCLPGRRRTACIDDVKRWTVGEPHDVRRLELDRK